MNLKQTISTWANERDRALGAVKNLGALVSSNDNARMLELFGGVRAAAGVMVTPETAQRVSAVYACVDRIAGGIATLPCPIYKREGQTRQVVEGDPLFFLLNEEPTASWTSAGAWSHALQQVLLRGDSHGVIMRRKSGVVTEIVPLPWAAVDPERQDQSIDSRNLYYVNDGIRTVCYDQDDVLHFHGYGYNGLVSMSVLSWGARQAAGNAIAMDEYSGRFFADGAHPSIALKTTGVIKKDKLEELQEMFARKYASVANAHRLPLILTEGMGVEAIGVNADDMQLIDARKFTVVDIARAFGVPPHLIGESSASTAWGTGLESIGRSFLMFTLEPHLRRLEQELNRKLFRAGGRFVEFDRSAWFRGDLKAQSDWYRAALGGPGTGPGWMTIDEVRAQQYLPPLPDGKGNKIFDPSVAPAKQSGNNPGEEAK